MEPFLQIAPHSLAIVLSRTGGDDSPGVTESDAPPHHHTGYEIFADFKSENMQHFWNKMVSDAIAETFFLGWIDEHVLLIQGKEDHLEVLREGWMRRTLKPPQGFDIKYLGKSNNRPIVVTARQIMRQCWADAMCIFNLLQFFPLILAFVIAYHHVFPSLPYVHLAHTRNCLMYLLYFETLFTQ